MPITKSNSAGNMPDRNTANFGLRNRPRMFEKAIRGHFLCVGVLVLVFNSAMHGAIADIDFA